MLQGRSFLFLTLSALAFCCSALFSSRATAAPFTPGNLVIYRVGNGTDSLANTGSPVFLDEFSPAGTLVQSRPMPTTASGANRRLVASGTTATLTVTATGTEPLTYQWYQGLSGDTTTPVGTNSANFTTPALTSTTSYWVRATTTSGPPANSNTATVTVSSPASDFTWTSDGSAITIIGYTGPGGDVAIPSAISGLTVTVIGNGAFRDKPALTGVTIPDSVTAIDELAFYNCAGMTSVKLSSNLTFIGTYAFRYCTSLAVIVIPGSASSFGVGVFEDCNGLSSATVSPGVESIGEFMFSKCTSLATVSLPDTILSIGEASFYGCTSLGSVTIPDSVVSIGALAFFQCTGLTGVTIPSSVTTILDAAFRECAGLISITLNNGLGSIGQEAFSNCTGLNKFEHPCQCDSYRTVWFHQLHKPGLRCVPWRCSRAWSGCFREHRSILFDLLPLRRHRVHLPHLAVLPGGCPRIRSVNRRPA